MPDSSEPADTEAPRDDKAATSLAVRSPILPETLHILPITERPFFPAQAQPLLLDKPAWLETVQVIGETEHHMAGLLLAGDAKNGVPTTEAMVDLGTAVRIHNPVHQKDHIQFIAEGMKRFKVLEWLTREPPFLARINYLEESADAPR